MKQLTLETSRFAENREFKKQVSPILHTARTGHQKYHAGQLSLEELHRSDWGAQLVAQMFSFLETMRLQGSDAIAQLCELLSLAGRSPPGLDLT